MKIGTSGRTLPEPLNGNCEEASSMSRNFYISCSAPSTMAVYHKKDDTTYRMCDACAYHNVRNRGGELLK